MITEIHLHAPPHLPVELFKDWLEENPHAVGMQDDPAFDREAAYLRWLTDSGVLRYLGLAMCQSLGVPWSRLFAMEEFESEPYSKWLEMAGVGSLPLYANPWNFERLCHAVGVPPVLCEINNAQWGDYISRQWGPPSPTLATDVLREAVKSIGFRPEHFFDVNDFEGCADRDCPCATIPAAVRHRHPEAIAFRLRLASRSDWRIRNLR